MELAFVDRASRSAALEGEKLSFVIEPKIELATVDSPSQSAARRSRARQVRAGLNNTYARRSGIQKGDDAHGRAN